MNKSLIPLKPNHSLPTKLIQKPYLKKKKALLSPFHITLLDFIHKMTGLMTRQLSSGMVQTSIPRMILANKSSSFGFIFLPIK